MVPDPFNLVGTLIDGRYRVERVVGEGGFGVVYRGHHESFDHPIAIKCLKIPSHFPSDAKQLFFDRFRTEGKHLAKLSEHPSITRVLDFGVAAGVPYMVQEWLEGMDLEQLLASRGTRLSEQEAVELLLPAIDALAFAHRLGIAHRDVKPANLYFATTARGRILKVLDFGIAKAMQEGETAAQSASRTSSGFNAYSPQYAAPEQLRSKKYGASGPWTDVHALGLVLAEMVVGRPAFTGDEAADYVLSCLAEARPTPRRLGTLVSDEFEALCARCVALEPRDRFADGAALLAAANAFLQGAPPTTVRGAPLESSTQHSGSAPSGSAPGVMTQLGSPPAVYGGLEAPPPRRSNPGTRKSRASWVVPVAAIAIAGAGAFAFFALRGGDTKPTTTKSTRSQTTASTRPTSPTTTTTTTTSTTSPPAPSSVAPPAPTTLSFPLAHKAAPPTQIQITNVTLTAAKTEIQFETLAFIPGACWQIGGENSPFLEIADGRTFAVTEVKNMSVCPSRKNLGKGDRFTLAFLPLPMEVSKFDLIEGAPGRSRKQGFWNFLGVQLSR